MVPDPWRKSRRVKIIAALDIVIATFSIFYNGKTLIELFGGSDAVSEEHRWVFILIILLLTFSIQVLQILLSMLLIKASKEHSITPSRATRILKLWCISSGIFLVLLVFELYIGLTHFEYNAWIVLFIFFSIGKLFWRIFGVYYVGAFLEDLKLATLILDPQVEFLKVPVQVVVTSESDNESISEKNRISHESA